MDIERKLKLLSEEYAKKRRELMFAEDDLDFSDSDDDESSSEKEDNEEVERIKAEMDVIRRKIDFLLEEKNERLPGNPIFTPDIPHYYVSGPKKLITMERKGQKVMLFGEYHEYSDNCDEEKLRGERIIDIVQYVDLLFNNSGKKIDFYLEAPIIHLQSEEIQKIFREQMSVEYKYKVKTGREKGVAYLIQLRDKLKWCINPNDRKKCDYKRMRIHSTDLRPFTQMGKIQDMLSKRRGFTAEEWVDFKNKYREDLEVMRDVKTCKDYAEYVLNLSYDIKKPVLQKQITKSGITIPKIKEAIINVCNAKDTLRWMESF